MVGTDPRITSRDGHDGEGVFLRRMRRTEEGHGDSASCPFPSQRVSRIDRAMPFRLLRSSLLVLIFSLTVASCGYLPRQVAGLPSGPSWEALPLRKWLAEDRA